MSVTSAWKDEYVVGNELVDGQHKELFAICRDLRERAASGRPLSRDDIRSRLENVFEEFRNHFDEEMQLYRRVYHLDYIDHEQHHADFLEKLADILDGAAKQTPDLAAVAKTVQGWLVRHILDEDIPQFEDLRKRGLAVEQAPGEVD